MGKTLGSTFTLACIQFGIMNFSIYSCVYEFVHMNLCVCICNIGARYEILDTLPFLLFCESHYPISSRSRLSPP